MSAYIQVFELYALNFAAQRSEPILTMIGKQVARKSEQGETPTSTVVLPIVCSRCYVSAVAWSRF